MWPVRAAVINLLRREETLRAGHGDRDTGWRGLGRGRVMEPPLSPAPSDLPLQGRAAGARATRPRVGGLPPGGSLGVEAPRPLRGDPPGGDSPAGVHAL